MILLVFKNFLQAKNLLLPAKCLKQSSVVFGLLSWHNHRKHLDNQSQQNPTHFVLHTFSVLPAITAFSPLPSKAATSFVPVHKDKNKNYCEFDILKMKLVLNSPPRQIEVKGNRLHCEGIDSVIQPLKAMGFPNSQVKQREDEIRGLATARQIKQGNPENQYKMERLAPATAMNIKTTFQPCDEKRSRKAKSEVKSDVTFAILDICCDVSKLAPANGCHRSNITNSVSELCKTL